MEKIQQMAQISLCNTDKSQSGRTNSVQNLLPNKTNKTN